MLYNKLIFDYSKEGRQAFDGFEIDNSTYDILDKKYIRTTKLNLVEVDELSIVRHYNNLAKINYGVDSGFYPLGSCTMKYNPKINESIASLPYFNTHPLINEKYAGPLLSIYYEMEEMLKSITGMDAFTLNPYAGSHGELTGNMIIKKYFLDKGDFNRTKVIVPDSAHGTNPASAAMAGFEIIEIKSNKDGQIDLDSLKEVLDSSVAALMLTNPNTTGVYEKNIIEICKLVHDNGSLMYYDGANLNAIMGVIKPRNMGFDVMHINLHKSFSTPHGGGGPGSGPVGVVSKLIDFLPTPVVKKTNNKFVFQTPKKTIGRISHFYGNYLVVVKAYSYLKSIGSDIALVSKYSILNSRYLKAKLSLYFNDPLKDIPCMHEFVLNGLKDNPNSIKTLDIAKSILDYGYHAPTIYFPNIFHESLMIEPTETENLDTLDAFVNVIKEIIKDSNINPNKVKSAPNTTSINRPDELKAARQLILKV
jgi:glycine dehydrogenase subunit 2